MDYTAITSTIAAVAALVGAVGVFLVNAKLDRLTGRVEWGERIIDAHVTAPGLHR